MRDFYIARFLLAALAPLPACAGAAVDCDYYEFREAIAYQNVAKFEALVAACRTPRFPQEKGGSTVLHLAAHVGRQLAPEFTRRLIAAGADAAAANSDGVTPMHMAARFDCAGCVPILKAAGASVMPRDPDGVTPLHEAGPNAVPALIAAGADPLARDAQGNQPLHRIWHPDLLVAGVNARNEAGLTPLHHAALAGSVWRIDKLLEAGADPTLRTTKASHWRAWNMSRSFGPGLPIPAGATPYDLAVQRQRETRFVTHEHDAAVKRLKEVLSLRNRGA